MLTKATGRADTITLLKKWCNYVRLENFIQDHCEKWRCTIGHISTEDISLEEAVRKADEMVEDYRKGQKAREGK